jgi:hypothetical protein
MNSQEAKMLSDLETFSKKVTEFTTELDRQIRYLISLRDAFTSVKGLYAPFTEKLRAGTSGLVPNPEAITDSFEKLAQAATNAPPPENLTIAPRFVLQSGFAPPAKQEPLWKTIQKVMGSKERFTIAEAGRAAEAARGTTFGPNRSQIVRNNLMRHDMRHDKIFRRNEDATWTVIVSADEKEAPEETS